MSEKSSDDEHIPMADEDPIEEEANPGVGSMAEIQSKQMEDVKDVAGPASASTLPSASSPTTSATLFDNDLSPEEQEEKARLIAQVLELQVRTYFLVISPTYDFFLQTEHPRRPVFPS